MYLNNFHDFHVEVQYIPAHTYHTLGHGELKHLPLPIGTKEEVAMKLSFGVPPTHILNGMCMNASLPTQLYYISTYLSFKDFYGFLPQ